jgi:glycosyltransferase involved in cell wall biosynthesis
VLWLSLHDITPRVIAVRQAVYCHNPSPFYRISLREALQDPKFLVFNQLYALLYRVFIRRNYCVIVQQNWLREEFIRRLGELPVVVAYPRLRAEATHLSPLVKRPFVFLYPSLPRVFKNLETLCKAVAILDCRGVDGFEVRLTLDGQENSYARWLKRKFGALTKIRFIGRLNSGEMASQYGEASAVVFPSKLETWGLPISEAKEHRLPLLVADLPYAHETVGSYDFVSFFPVESAETLADLMESMINLTWVPTGCDFIRPSAPFAQDWASLWKFLIDGLPLATACNSEKAE